MKKRFIRKSDRERGKLAIKLFDSHNVYHANRMNISCRQEMYIDRDTPIG